MATNRHSNPSRSPRINQTRSIADSSTKSRGQYTQVHLLWAFSVQHAPHGDIASVLQNASGFTTLLEIPYNEKLSLAQIRIEGGFSISKNDLDVLTGHCRGGGVWMRVRRMLARTMPQDSVKTL